MEMQLLASSRLCLLLWAEHGATDVGSGQPDVGGLLDLVDKVHGREVSTRALEGGDELDVDRGLGSEILLGHGSALCVLEAGASLLESLCDVIGNLLCGDNVFGAVDLGEMLAFATLLGCLGGYCEHVRKEKMWPDRVLTLVVPYFFSVPTTAPVRWAALSALLPLMTVSRCAAPEPPALLPILVT